MEGVTYLIYNFHFCNFTFIHGTTDWKDTLKKLYIHRERKLDYIVDRKKANIDKDE